MEKSGFRENPSFERFLAGMNEWRDPDGNINKIFSFCSFLLSRIEVENRRTNRSIDVANSSTFRPDGIRRDLRCDASGQLGNDTFEIVGNFERFFQVNPYGGIFGQMMKPSETGRSAKHVSGTKGRGKLSVPRG